MRAKYMSPTSLMLHESNPEECYMRYISDNPPPRMMQTEPMSVGSAFDAAVKGRLNVDLGLGLAFTADDLFYSSVEPHNRDFAQGAGEVVMDGYVADGSYSRLLRLLGGATDVWMDYDSQFEWDGVPVFGKPDLGFSVLCTDEQVSRGRLDRALWRVVLDWKVNGFCSKSGGRAVAGHSRHKDFFPCWVGPLEVSCESYLEHREKKWATQTCVYSVMDALTLGLDLEDEPLVLIDQVLCRDGSYVGTMEHVSGLSVGFRDSVRSRFVSAWDVWNSDWFFRDLTRAESMEKCAALDARADTFIGDDKDTEWLKRIYGRH